MNRLSQLRRFLLPALVGAGLLATGFAVAAGFAVTLGAAGPTPGVQTIAWGDTVTWSNADTVPHQVSSSRANFTSQTIPSGGTFAYVYTTPGVGTYGYRQLGPKKNFSGSIVVTLTGEVTLKASKPVVTFGQAVSLSGRSTVPNSDVTISERPVGGGSWVDLAKVPVGADGAFSMPLTPKVGARYRATAASRQVVSPQVTLGVAPVVTAQAGVRKAKTGAIVRIVVRITPHAAGHSAGLFAYVPSRKQWVRAASPVALKDGVAIFRWRALPGRTLLRGWLVNADLEPGFAPAFSKAISVTTPPPPPKKHK